MGPGLTRDGVPTNQYLLPILMSIIALVGDFREPQRQISKVYIEAKDLH